MNRTRRTKIVATVGPACDAPEQLEALIDAGVDVFRLSMAHDDIDTVLDRVTLIRSISDPSGTGPAILIDLPGPKVRAGTFGDEGVTLVGGAEIELRPGLEPSTAEVIHVSHEALVTDVRPGDRLHLGDGKATMQVVEVGETSVRAQILHGGVMRGRPGVHIPSDRLSITTPTEFDLEALQAVVAAGVDMVAISFVRSAADIRSLTLPPPPEGPMVIAKIETQAAVEQLDAILEASDALMVARGDLGLECSLAQIPALQKQIIEATVRVGRPVITATQMLETMIDNPQPTRAEVSDVANAVFDGTSAVMLSGETAVGRDPVHVVEMMDEILRNAEAVFDAESWAAEVEEMGQRATDEHGRIANSVSAAASRAIRALAPPAVVCITGSGATARAITRYRPHAAVLAVTANVRAFRQLHLVWGATPILAQSPGEEAGRIRNTLAELHQRGYLDVGQIVPVVAGSTSEALASNVLRVETVEPPTT
ncbi:MAG: pyruvate kinase [Ilumatobacter sp.]|nr:pyruvate kinase [Ilumatobacter sp.]